MKVPKWLRTWKKNPAYWNPSLDNIIIDNYVTGNVVPIRKVPRAQRKAYENTLRRFALACHRAGYGPGGTKGKRQVNSSYRSLAEQQALYNQNMISPGNPKPGHALTAVPNPNAPHVRGIGLDIPNVREETALIIQCRELGLMDDVASEKWHLTNHRA